jgi:hypothetical protein
MAAWLSLPHAQPILSFSYDLLHLKSQKPDSELSDRSPWLNQPAHRSHQRQYPTPMKPFDALILHVGSQMSLLTATSLPDSVLFNVPMMPRPLP